MLPPHPLATTILFSASVSLTILDTSWKWDEAVVVLLWLTYFTGIVLLQMVGFPSFISTEWYSIVRTHHIFSVCSSAGGPLGCLHTLEQSEECCSERGSADYLFNILIAVLLDISPEVGFLDHMVVLYLIFEEPTYCFAQWLPHFVFPPAVPRISSFSTSCQHLLSFIFLIIAIIIECEGELICDFHLHFPWWLVSTFVCTHWPPTWVR